MAEQLAQAQSYAVSVGELEPGGALTFTFDRRNGQRQHGANGSLRRSQQFIVTARQGAGGLTFDWSTTPDDPGAQREDIQAEIAARLEDRARWIDSVTNLVGQVEEWVREMGWSTRRVEKKLDDPRIGKHCVPALLMQEDTCRVLLEPVGRAAPGTQGVVDLYVLPAYDDIASFYWYDNQWNVHYAFSGTPRTAPVRQAEAMPLTKDALAKVLAEIKQHAT